MRRSPQILVLIALLVLGIVFVSWYVFVRKAQPAGPVPTPVAAPEGPTPLKPKPEKAGATQGPQPVPGTATAAPEPVDLTKHDGQTIDFSSGAPEVKQTKEDAAAMKEALKEMRESTSGATFGPKKGKETAGPKSTDEASSQSGEESSEQTAEEPQGSDETPVAASMAPAADLPAPVSAPVASVVPAPAALAAPAVPQIDLTKVGAKSVSISANGATVSRRTKEEMALLRRKVNEMRKASSGITFGPTKPKTETPDR